MKTKRDTSAMHGPLLCFTALLGMAALVSVAWPENPLDPVIKLYICQTEYELNRITEWETSDPIRYREAVKNGHLTPVDAAQDAAGFLVATDRIRCGKNNNVEIETPGKNGRSATVSVLDDGNLERHCPQTMKKYGHPCK